MSDTTILQQIPEGGDERMLGWTSPKLTLPARVKRRNQRTLTGMGVVNATVEYLSRHSKNPIPWEMGARHCWNSEPTRPA
jgi:hypothetical protein